MLPNPTDLRDLRPDELRAVDGGKRAPRGEDTLPPIMIVPICPLPIEYVSLA